MKDIFKWELISEEDVSPSKWFPIFRQKLKVSPTKIIDDFYLAKLGDVVCTAPLTPEGKFIMVRQYKRGVDGITLEFPAGRFESPENAEDAAKRELTEETGAVCEKILLLGKTASSSTKTTTLNYLFLAYNCKYISEQKLDENEDIEVVEISPTELLEKIKSDETTDATTLCTITFIQNNYPEVFTA